MQISETMVACCLILYQIKQMQEDISNVGSDLDELKVG
jgi:hypothetical protein